jgi:hypothetical protein
MLDAAERLVWYKFSFEKEGRIGQGMQQCSTGFRETRVHVLFLQSRKCKHHMSMRGHHRIPELAFFTSNTFFYIGVRASTKHLAAS